MNCKHCKKPVEIRNPSGKCDHLYYPENCTVCINIRLLEKGFALLSKRHEDFEIQKILADLYFALLDVPKIKFWVYIPLAFKIAKLEMAHADCCGVGILDEEDESF